MSQAAFTELVALLEADRGARPRKYPQQALPAVRDDRVAAALGKHLDAGARVVGIHALPYQATLGLIPIVFELASGAARPSVMVLLDGRGAVAGVIDGYDPARPNPAIPSAQPFVLAQPSVATSTHFTVEELQPRWDRVHAYVAAAIPSHLRTGVEGDDGTLCPDTTVRSTALYAIPTICGGLFIKSVDDHRTMTQPDNTMDLVVDDSEIVIEPL